MNKDKIVGNV